MPAASQTICRAIAEAVHPALFAQMEAFGVRPAIPLGKEDTAEIYVSALFSQGPSKGGHLYKLPTGGSEYDIFGPCSIAIELSVPRFTKDPIVIAGVYSRLGQEVARVQDAFSFNQGSALNARLPFHKLTHLIPGGIQLGFSEERGDDLATMTYICDAGILPDAWPLTIIG